MVANPYEEQLNAVYQKYYCCSGECANYSKCKKGLARNGLLFNRAKIGKYYGTKYRKVLVVGKEPVSENGEITATASLEEAKNPHYRRTLYTLAMILDKEPESDSISDLNAYKKLLDYFCLTNYFKCSFTETETTVNGKKAKKNSGIKVNNAMKQECWKILIDEIDNLKPEIIIIQGKMWCEAFFEEVQKRYGKAETKCKAGYEELTKHENGPDGGPLYIVWAYHPTARAKCAWNQRLKNLRNVLGKLRECLTLEE